jgi:hypothetical protein
VAMVGAGMGVEEAADMVGPAGVMVDGGGLVVGVGGIEIAMEEVGVVVEGGILADVVVVAIGAVTRAVTRITCGFEGRLHTIPHLQMLRGQVTRRRQEWRRGSGRIG